MESEKYLRVEKQLVRIERLLHSGWEAIYDNTAFLVLFTNWFLFGLASNFTNKYFLEVLPLPLTMTWFQFAFSSLGGLMLMTVLKVRPIQRLNSCQLLKQIVPLSVAYLLTYTLGHVSVGKVPLSFHHSIKASAPIFAVVLSRFFLNEIHETSVYISLIPIIGGVSVATATELSFEFVGFVTAFLSTFISVCQTIYSKFLFENFQMDHFNVQFYLSTVSAILLFPLCIFWEVLPFLQDNTKNLDLVQIAGMLLVNSCSYWIQNVLAFALVSKITTLTYAIAGVTKRIILITSSVLYFGNPVNWLNGIGIALSVSGVGLYHASKYLERSKKLQHFNDEKV